MSFPPPEYSHFLVPDKDPPSSSLPPNLALSYGTLHTLNVKYRSVSSRGASFWSWCYMESPAVRCLHKCNQVVCMICFYSESSH